MPGEGTGSVRILVGLGNPGQEYEPTRHNLGFRIVERLADRHRLPAWKRRGVRLQTSGTIAGRPVVIVKPLTFMNRSGRALSELAGELAFQPSELLVCYDDLALPLGRLRIRPSGSHGGHNGMRSVVEGLGTTGFPRLRLGIWPDSGGVPNPTDFVLSPFRRSERPVIEEAVERAAEAVECLLAEGLTTAMNRYNAEPERRSP